MTQITPTPDRLSIDDLPWPEVTLPPTDLLYDDGAKMESPWHADSIMLIKAGYIAARGGRRDDYYVGVNMFVYYSMNQVRNLDYRGPDAFIVKNVDGLRQRLYWAVWEEDGRYPDVIFELLSKSTESQDLGAKKDLYERTFRTAEYFCIAPEVERLLGWRLEGGAYVPIAPNERGWLWSAELGLWLGPWRGVFMTEEHTWPRFYTAAGDLVLLPDELALQQLAGARQRAEEERQRAEEERQRAEEERQRAEEERQRADTLAERLAAMEAELARLRGQVQ